MVRIAWAVMLVTLALGVARADQESAREADDHGIALWPALRCVLGVCVP